MNFFGSKLNELIEYDREQEPDVVVPILFSRLWAYCYALGVRDGVTGLFKTAGNGKEVDQLYSAIATGGSVVDEDDFKALRDIHVFPSVLKLFLRQLPDCLLESARYDAWVALSAIT